MVSLLAFSVVSPLRASAFVVDFEAFPDGYILGPTDLGNGITVSVVAEHGEGDDSDSDPDLEPVAPVVFDSDCSSKKCKKEEKDLRTPGTGLGTWTPSSARPWPSAWTGSGAWHTWRRPCAPRWSWRRRISAASTARPCRRG